MRRHRGDSIRPASAHAGQITNGGTATEPNGVASPARRMGGMPGAPTRIQSIRRATRSTSVGTDRRSTGTAVTTPTHDGRYRMQINATYSIAAYAAMAAVARRLIPRFMADAVAIPKASTSATTGRSMGVWGRSPPRTATSANPAIAPMAMRCSPSWNRASHSAPSQPT